jgi:hypothetical protein
LLGSFDYFYDARLVDDSHAGKIPERVDARDVQFLIVPEIMIAKKEIDIELEAAEVFLKYLKCFLVREYIYLLAVVKKIPQKDYVFYASI